MRRALELVALLLLIAVAGSLWHGGPEANGESPIGVVDLEIGGQQFAIPRPYIANIARESDGSAMFVRLSAVAWARTAYGRQSEPSGT